MNQQKFNHVAILQTSKTITENIWLVDVANKFVNETKSMYVTSVNLPGKHATGHPLEGV